MKKDLREAIAEVGMMISEGAKYNFVTHRKAVDDIISNNKRTAQVLAKNKADYAKAFKQDADKLEKALAKSAKLARAFWEDWHAEF